MVVIKVKMTQDENLKSSHRLMGLSSTLFFLLLCLRAVQDCFAILGLRIIALPADLRASIWVFVVYWWLYWRNVEQIVDVEDGVVLPSCPLGKTGIYEFT